MRQLITVPEVAADPVDACRECQVELRRCLVCGHTGCCESSERQHGKTHFLGTGHPVVANQSGGIPWGYCYADQFALLPD